MVFQWSLRNYKQTWKTYRKRTVFKHRQKWSKMTSNMSFWDYQHFLRVVKPNIQCSKRKTTTVRTPPNPTNNVAHEFWPPWASPDSFWAKIEKSVSIFTPDAATLTVHAINQLKRPQNIKNCCRTSSKFSFGFQFVYVECHTA